MKGLAVGIKLDAHSGQPTQHVPQELVVRAGHDRTERAAGEGLVHQIAGVRHSRVIYHSLHTARSSPPRHQNQVNCTHPLLNLSTILSI